MNTDGHIIATHSYYFRYFIITFFIQPKHNIHLIYII